MDSLRSLLAASCARSIAAQPETDATERRLYQLFARVIDPSVAAPELSAVHYARLWPIAQQLFATQSLLGKIEQALSRKGLILRNWLGALAQAGLPAADLELLAAKQDLSLRSCVIEGSRHYLLTDCRQAGLQGSAVQGLVLPRRFEQAVALLGWPQPQRKHMRVVMLEGLGAQERCLLSALPDLTCLVLAEGAAADSEFFALLRQQAGKIQRVVIPTSVTVTGLRHYAKCLVAQGFAFELQGCQVSKQDADYVQRHFTHEVTVQLVEEGDCCVSGVLRPRGSCPAPALPDPDWAGLISSLNLDTEQLRLDCLARGLDARLPEGFRRALVRHILDHVQAGERRRAVDALVLLASAHDSLQAVGAPEALAGFAGRFGPGLLQRLRDPEVWSMLKPTTKAQQRLARLELLSELFGLSLPTLIGEWMTEPKAIYRGMGDEAFYRRLLAQARRDTQLKIRLLIAQVHGLAFSKAWNSRPHLACTSTALLQFLRSGQLLWLIEGQTLELQIRNDEQLAAASDLAHYKPHVVCLDLSSGPAARFQSHLCRLYPRCLELLVNWEDGALSSIASLKQAQVDYHYASTSTLLSAAQHGQSMAQWMQRLRSALEQGDGARLALALYQIPKDPRLEESAALLNLAIEGLQRGLLTQEDVHCLHALAAAQPARLSVRCITAKIMLPRALVLLQGGAWVWVGEALDLPLHSSVSLHWLGAQLMGECYALPNPQECAELYRAFKEAGLHQCTRRLVEQLKALPAVESWHNCDTWMEALLVQLDQEERSQIELAWVTLWSKLLGSRRALELPIKQLGLLSEDSARGAILRRHIRRLRLWRKEDLQICRVLPADLRAQFDSLDMSADTLSADQLAPLFPYVKDTGGYMSCGRVDWSAYAGPERPVLKPSVAPGLRSDRPCVPLKSALSVQVLEGLLPNLMRQGSRSVLATTPSGLGAWLPQLLTALPPDSPRNPDEKASVYAVLSTLRILRLIPKTAYPEYHLPVHEVPVSDLDWVQICPFTAWAYFSEDKLEQGQVPRATRLIVCESSKPAPNQVRRWHWRGKALSYLCCY